MADKFARICRITSLIGIEIYNLHVQAVPRPCLFWNSKYEWLLIFVSYVPHVVHFMLLMGLDLNLFKLQSSKQAKNCCLWKFCIFLGGFEEAWVSAHKWSSCSQSLRILSNGRSCHGHQTTAPGHTYEVEMFQRPILRRSFVRRRISVLMFLYHENIVVNRVNKKELRNMMWR